MAKRSPPRLYDISKNPKFDALNTMTAPQNAKDLRQPLWLKVAFATLISIPFAGQAAAQTSGEIAWRESFSGSDALPDWIAPFGESGRKIGAIYSVESDSQGGFLHAKYNGHLNGLKPIHYGKTFQSSPIPLEKIKSLKWRWRVDRHPDNSDKDPWLDVAASLYIIIKQPSLFSSGRGFKFGWLSRHGGIGTSQRGLLQIALREDQLTGEWRVENVDLCSLYRKHFGPCEGQFLRYVGVVTDGDGTHSLSEAAYTDFEIVTKQ